MTHRSGSAGPAVFNLDDAIPAITPDQARRAALQAAGAIQDRDDLRDVLDMLGIAEVLR